MMVMTAMTAVTQEHGTGCAVACVAYLLGVPYQKALSLFKKPSHAWGRGYYCSEVVEALRRGGKTYAYCNIKSGDIRSKSSYLRIPDIIVYVNPSTQYPLGHYLARSRNGTWMNPWTNCPIIAPAESAFQARLPGRPTYVIYPV